MKGFLFLLIFSLNVASFSLSFIKSNDDFNGRNGTSRVIQDSDDYSWQLQKDENGIKVYLRKVAGSKAREFKVTSTISTTMDGAIALIKDDKVGLEWIQRAITFKTLKTVNNKQWYTYTELAIPWPFENRDLITRNTISQDSTTKTVVVTLLSHPDFIKEKNGVTRIRKSEGSWTLKPLNNGNIEATYIIFSEQAKTFIPLGIITPIIVNGLHTSIEKFRDLSGKDKYRQASLPYIQ